MRIKQFNLNDDGTVTDIQTGEILDAVPPNGRLRITHPVEGVSLTHQSFAEKCDVNNIIKNFEQTGVLPPDLGDGVYDDVTGLQGDLTSLINQSTQTMDKANADLSKYYADKAAAAAAKDLETSPTTSTPSA